MRNRVLRAIVFAAMIASSCRDNGMDSPGQQNTPRQGDYALPVFETTDMHGYIVSNDADATHYRLAYIADKVEDLRAEASKKASEEVDVRDLLLLLDGGDHYQGASVSNMLDGWPMYVAMDRMGYDAVALGNHEFDWGFDKMVESDATLPAYDWEGQHFSNEVPVLCSNLYRDGERVSSTRDYIIVEKTAVGPGGSTVKVRIGIIGFADNYAGSIMASKFTGLGFSVKEDYSIVSDLAARLEEAGECDATVLLTHCAAPEAANGLGRESAVDLVLGGHSHRTLSGRTDWGLPYLQGGRYCEHYAQAYLRFTVDGQGNVSFWKVDDLRTPAVDASRDLHASPGQNSADLSEAIMAVSDEAIARSSDKLGEVIGYINVDATSYYIPGSDGRAAVISNWMCDILRRIGQADVAFVNSGGVRTSISLDGHPKRNITVANVYEMFPFDNLTYVYDLTYEELLKVFEYSMTSGGLALFSRVTGIDCAFTRTDYESYSVYAVKSLSKDGTVIYSDGRWTSGWASRPVRLAVSEYLATSERTDYYTGIPNPLIEWNGTSRLIANSLIDNENAVRVLESEADASGGLLYIDTEPHFRLVE